MDLMNASSRNCGLNGKSHEELHRNEDGQASRPLKGASHDSRTVLELVIDAKAIAFGVLEAGSKDRTISVFDSKGSLVSVETNGLMKKVRSSLAQKQAIVSLLSPRHSC